MATGMPISLTQLPMVQHKLTIRAETDSMHSDEPAGNGIFSDLLGYCGAFKDISSASDVSAVEYNGVHLGIMYLCR